MRRIIPKTRMGIFTFLLVSLWIIWNLIVPAAIERSLPPWLVFILNLITPLLAISAVYYSHRLFSVIRRRLLWKIRRRLILAHIFIGAIPVLLIVLISYVSALLIYYQLSHYLISNQIGIHTSNVHAFNLSLRNGLQETMRQTAEPSALKAALDRDVRYLLGTYPFASVILRCTDTASGKVYIFGDRNVNAEALKDYQIPPWLGNREFYGLVLEDAQIGVYRNAGQNGPVEKWGRLFVRSLIFSDSGAKLPFSLEVSVPFDLYLLDRLKAALGQDLLLADSAAMSGLSVMPQSTDILQQKVLYSTFEMESDQQPLGRPIWSVLLFPTSWSKGAEISTADSDILFVELSMWKLVQDVFREENSVSRSTENSVGKTILGALEIVIGFFLLVEVASLVMGIVLTKSITSAVYSLDRGTEFIKRGDFSHRIVVRSNDQLGALAASFNQMTEYVQSLVKERVEKERLERELEIAKEVQEQLFPRQLPKMEKIDLAGLCLPARMVSGDYYDFLPFGAHRLGLAVADICGKGISAALLMANLQATLRSNVIRLSQGEGNSVENNYSELPVANVMRLLNQQIYNYTSANKFASFFYAVYDELQQTLTYCNAGHNPPLYFNGDEAKRLTIGGTVVGILPNAVFEQETIHLNSGDVVLAYTDGIIESVNEYGEEFGEERLIQLVQRNRGLSAQELQQVIVTEVLSWTYEEERNDDMTLIIAGIR